jgi:branched-chain amino acid transport system permease protein
LAVHRKRLIEIASLGAFVVIFFLVPVFIKSTYWISVLTLVVINVLLTSSLRTIRLLGYISLGHVGFSLIGAYSSALLSRDLGLSVWLTLPIAGLWSAVLALALGYPFLKVKGMYFAILTLLTSESFRLTAWHWRDLTGGTWGLLHIPPPSPITLPVVGLMDFAGAGHYYYLALVIVMISLLVLYLLEKSTLGFHWRLIQDAEDLAQSVGINVMKYKILNFAISCFFAGIAGALFAHYQHTLTPDLNGRFGVMMSIYLLVYMVVGGEGKFAGQIIGVLILMLVSELARPLREYQPIIFGVLSILVVILLPEGFIDLPNRFMHWFGRLMKTNAGHEAQS